jgi:hypothetical protein
MGGLTRRDVNAVVNWLGDNTSTACKKRLYGQQRNRFNRKDTWQYLHKFMTMYIKINLKLIGSVNTHNLGSNTTNGNEAHEEITRLNFGNHHHHYWENSPYLSLSLPLPYCIPFSLLWISQQ